MRRTIILLALAGLLGGCATSGPGVVEPVGSAVDRGRFVALRSCAGCHAVGGTDISPNHIAPPFSLIRMKHDEAGLRRLLADISRNGHYEMPPIYMTEDEIRDVSAYIQTVEPEPETHPGLSRTIARLIRGPVAWPGLRSPT
jgi:cytochrome c